jgi:hypothetical protein
MNPRRYEALRVERGAELKHEVPNAVNEIRVVSTPPTIVQAGQMYLRMLREKANPENASDYQLPGD